MNNVVANNLCSEVGVFHIALFRDSQIGELNYSHYAIGSTNNYFNEPTSAHKDGVEATLKSTCIGTSIDDFVVKFSVRNPEYVKLEVDGNELDILNGVCAILKSPVKEICIEFNARGIGSIKQLREFLFEFGFALSEQISHAKGVGNAIFKK